MEEEHDFPETEVIQSTPVESGNMTVVIRNNRKKIDRSTVMGGRNGDPLADDPGRSAVAVESGPRHSMRPSYHYMYMVRKVPAGRNVISNGVVAKSATVASDNATLGNGVNAEAINDDHRLKSVIASGSQDEQEDEDDVFAAEGDLNRLERGTTSPSDAVTAAAAAEAGEQWSLSSTVDVGQ